MLDINVIKSTETLMIEWQFARVNIPLEEIIEVTDDTASTNQHNHAVKIGIPHSTINPILIKTLKLDYLLFTNNKISILNEINS